MISLAVNKERKNPNYLKVRKNNVLMVCSTFPPQSSVGGLRPAMFSKYLPKYGWSPIIFTRVLPQNDPLWDEAMKIDGLPHLKDRIKVIYGTRDEEKAFKNRKIIALLKYFICPDFSHPPGLLNRMLSAIENEMVPKDLNAVWGTCGPLGCLTASANIAKRFRIPWIADFRDIHEQNRINDFRTKLLHHRIYIRRSIITRTASAIVTVSENHANLLKKCFKREVYVIHNGFDPEVFPLIPAHHSDTFSIIYMGRILNEWFQNPKVLFEGLDILLKNKKLNKENFQIKFFGTDPAILKDLLSSYQCKDFVQILPRIAYKQVPVTLQKSCVLLLLTNKDRLGILTTKAFEYLAAKRPILCVPGDGGELDALLKKTHAGVSCPTPESVACILNRWYNEWKQMRTVACNSLESEISQYSRKRQAKQLADILNAVSGSC